MENVEARDWGSSRGGYVDALGQRGGGNLMHCLMTFAIQASII